MANQYSSVMPRTPEEVSQRRAFVVHCKMKHMMWEDIQNAVEARFKYRVSLVQLAEDYRKVMKWRNKELREDIDACRTLALTQLDRAAAAILPKVEAGDLDALDRYLKVQQRKAKLLGLDAPTQHEDVTPRAKLTAEELIARMAAITKRLQAAKAAHSLEPQASPPALGSGLPQALELASSPRDPIPESLELQDPDRP